MKPVLPKSFYIIRGIIYFLLFSWIALSTCMLFGAVVPSVVGGKTLPFRYHSEKIDLNTTKTPDKSVLSLQYFKPQTLAKHKEGEITLHSKTGKQYKGFYSPTFAKLLVYVPDDFLGSLKIIMLIVGGINLILSILFLYILAKLLSSLEDGSPFVMKNAQYLGLVAGMLFYSILSTVIAQWLMESYIESVFNLSFNRHWSPALVNAAFITVVIAILSYVLKQGVRMKEEQDLTI